MRSSEHPPSSLAALKARDHVAGTPRASLRLGSAVSFSEPWRQLSPLGLSRCFSVLRVTGDGICARRLPSLPRKSDRASTLISPAGRTAPATVPHFPPPTAAGWASSGSLPEPQCHEFGHRFGVFCRRGQRLRAVVLLDS